MIINNKIEKTLNGPTLFMGITFLFLGIVFTSQKGWIPGIVLITIATFLFLTYSGVEIDTEKHRIKSYYKLFGLIKRGKWSSLNGYKGVTLVPMRKVRRTFSRSNRQVSTTERFFMIFLVNKANKPELPIKKCKTLEVGQDSLDEFSLWLKIPVFSVKK